MWFVYVLSCKDKSLYTGITNDIEKRLKAHQGGKGGRYTRAHLPVKLVYLKRYKTRSAALKREAQIKKIKREEKLRLINQLHI